MRRKTITLISALMFFVGISATISIMAPEAKAEGKCNLLTVKGSYGYLNTGSFGVVPLASVGTITFDGAGLVSGNDTNSFGGTVSSNPFTGSYTVNADCTGTVAVSFFGGAFTINNNMVIVDNGKEIFVIETNPGSVATGVFKRQ
jgi:hypothetical protein